MLRFKTRDQVLVQGCDESAAHTVGEPEEMLWWIELAHST